MDVSRNRTPRIVNVCDNCMRERELKKYNNGKELCVPCAKGHGLIRTQMAAGDNAKVVITAKTHLCANCTKSIKKGTKAIAVQFRSTEYGLYREYYCLNCRELV